jgi:hypothetical protein
MQRPVYIHTQHPSFLILALETMDCVICHEDLLARPVCCVIPCGHSAFHVDCFQKWSLSSDKPFCPLCTRPFTGYNPIQNALHLTGGLVAFQLTRASRSSDLNTVLDALDQLAHKCSTALCQECSIHRHNFQKLFGHAIMSCVMKRWKVTAQVQAKALLVLINGSSGDWSLSLDDRSLISADLFESIIRALEYHSRDALVQHYGLGAIRNITKGQPHTLAMFVDCPLNGVNVVIKTMKAFPTSLSIQLTGAKILQAASWCDQASILFEGSTGVDALAVLAAAMRKHSDTAMENVASQAKASIARLQHPWTRLTGKRRPTKLLVLGGMVVVAIAVPLAICVRKCQSQR